MSFIFENIFCTVYVKMYLHTVCNQIERNVGQREDHRNILFLFQNIF